VWLDGQKIAFSFGAVAAYCGDTSALNIAIAGYYFIFCCRSFFTTTL
jgi:hypothetical protein